MNNCLALLGRSETATLPLFRSHAAAGAVDRRACPSASKVSDATVARRFAKRVQCACALLPAVLQTRHGRLAVTRRAGLRLVGV
ncbi:MAG: hypothetical protein H6981_05870 [Gammaproteobacteria bacterium]|nr:hypothetical protein [Gammaproteobacteria bacterium]